ncbi:MAG: hypothetical protein IPO37_15865 [Saprospiraceae bacterium]|nr:hypothetical protein [Saprospiraceae bacterium]
MENNNSTREINPNGLILLWAFAESGIGGILHALKLPFTGIFVGGIAIICISLLSYFTNNRLTILKALGVVLLVKFTVSPHSPWQAYVAVVFQAYLGYFLFKSNKHFNAKCLIFSLVCMLESAIQRVLIMVFIYGMTFMKAVDKAALSFAQTLGINEIPSFVFGVFSIYIFLHIVAGVILGLWLPTIPHKLWNLDIKIPETVVLPSRVMKKNVLQALSIGFLILAGVLMMIKFLVPELPATEIIYIFIRSLLVSVGLIFIFGPVMKAFILKNTTDTSHQNQQLLKEIVADIPDFAGRALALVHQVNNEYTGVKKLKIYILGLLQLSLDYKK